MSTNLTAGLLLGRPGDPPKLNDALTSFLSANTCNNVQAAFAYVSLAGLSPFVNSIFRQDLHRNIKKRWIVGIHHGITEPAAIEALLSHPNSTVRIYSATGKINNLALFTGDNLHSKTICLTSDKNVLFLLGSANLTRAAVGVNCKNYEANAMMQMNGKSDYIIFNKWFDNIWSRSIQGSATIVDRYSQARDRFLRENRVVVPELDELPAGDAGIRLNLWIEAGAMSGGDRHQIEFGRALAAFFGPPARRAIRLRMRWRRVSSDDRPLSFKITQWNTEIWRLGLITSSQGGPSYPGQIIHFARMRDDSGEYFLLEVESPNSTKARLWRRQANRNGTLAMTGIGTGSAREYGIY